MTGTILTYLGGLLIVIGTIGILRFRDVYSRLQASGISDNVGLTLLLIGLIVNGGWDRHDWTLVLLIALLLATNPVATHSIAKSAFVQGHSQRRER